MIENKNFDGWVNAVLSACGYIRKKNSWYLARQETISIVNFQKSQWGDQYYVNCAVFVTGAQTLKNPAFYKADIVFRIEDLMNGDAGEFWSVIKGFDSNADLGLRGRKFETDEFSIAITKFTEITKSIDALKSALETGLLKLHSLRLSAYSHLGLKNE